MKPSTKRALSVILAAFLLLGLLFFYNYLIRPEYDGIIKLAAEIGALKENYRVGKSLSDEFEKIYSQYPNLEELEANNSLIFPLKPDVAYAVSQVSGIAKLYNLKLKNLTVNQLAIKPSSGDLVKGIGALRFTLEIEGEYENFKSYLEALETNMLLFDLISLKIETLKGQFLNYKMTVDTYYQVK